MGHLVRVGCAFFLVTGLGCLKPQSENPGAQTPAQRSVPPETGNYMKTDGPTQPRSAAQRPPEPEQRGSSGSTSGGESK